MDRGGGETMTNNVFWIDFTNCEECDEVEEDAAPERPVTAPGGTSTIDVRRRGWHVFPVFAYPSTDGKRGEKHPLSRWRTECALRRDWGSRWPGGANAVGIDCGRSGLVVIDEDSPGAVGKWLGSPLPATYTVRTHQGFQYYFQAGNWGIRNSVKLVAPGVDIRGAGGFVVAEGSAHGVGGENTYVRVSGNADVAPMPDWLAEAILSVAPAVEDRAERADHPPGDPTTDEFRARLDGRLKRLSETEAGSRNSMLFWVARLLGAYDAPAECDAEVVEVALSIALSRAEVLATLRSGRKHGIEHRAEVLGDSDVFVEMKEGEPVAGNEDAFDADVARAVHRLQVREAAIEKLAEIRADAEFAALPPADSGLLSDMLARDPEPPERIVGLLPDHGNMVVAAQNKTGKTTFGINLARCLLTGEPFLERFEVSPIEGSVGVWNHEVTGPQFARWASENGCPLDRVYIDNLRARPSPLASPAARKRASDALIEWGCTVLIVDPFGKAFHGVEQNSNSEVQRWLNQLDEFAHESGIEHTVLITHAGWAGEHSRGASALEGWPDSIVRLVKNEAGIRFMSAEGRDVLVEEDMLSFEEGSRRLSLADMGSRRDVADMLAVTKLVQPVAEFVALNPGCSQRDIEKGLDGTATVKRRAVRAAIEDGLIRVEVSGRGHKHYPIEASDG